MIRDALICRKGEYGWRWCVVPADLIDAFRAHGWIVVLSSDEMHDIWNAAIDDARTMEIQKWEPLNQMRFKRPACNGD